MGTIHWRYCLAHSFAMIALVLIVSRESTAFTPTRTILGVAPKSSLASPLSSMSSRRVLRLKDSQLITDISFQDDSSSPDRSKEEESVQDAKGVTVSVGNVVRVCVPNLKAHQIQPKFHGSFHPDTKEFIPVVDSKSDESPSSSSTTTTTTTRRTALILPVGLRGEVTKVYTAANLSANFPIQVKFTPGQHMEEGYDAPSAFVMHFASNEVEVV